MHCTRLAPRQSRTWEKAVRGNRLAPRPRRLHSEIPGPREEDATRTRTAGPCEGISEWSHRDRYTTLLSAYLELGRGRCRVAAWLRDPDGSTQKSPVLGKRERLVQGRRGPARGFLSGTIAIATRRYSVHTSNLGEGGAGPPLRGGRPCTAPCEEKALRAWRKRWSGHPDYRRNKTQRANGLESNTPKKCSHRKACK